jgi:hypothetical protein
MFNNWFLFRQGFWVIELAIAAAVIFWAFNLWRTKPDGAIARLLRHRDRIWFALILLFVPAIGIRFLIFHLFFNRMIHGSGIVIQIVNIFFAVYDGAVYGIAACWFASPAKRDGRFGYWMAFVVAVVLMILNSVLFMAIRSFRFAPVTDVQMIPAGVVILAFLISRAFVRKQPGIQPENTTSDALVHTEPKHNPGLAMMWLLVGLVPIPVLLVLVSQNPPNRSWAPVVFIVCAICNLCGGLGCLGGIKNVAVRILLGIFLGVFFFLLSWLVAAFEACSHSGAM